MASFISAAEAFGNSDHSSAIAPVTKGAAALVPPEGQRLAPGAEASDPIAGCARVPVCRSNFPGSIGPGAYLEHHMPRPG